MLTAHQRRHEMSALIHATGHSSVTELAERFGVTQETIRRDLTQLEQAGIVQWIHGGAVAMSSAPQSRRSYAAAEHLRPHAKRSIASLASSLAPQGATSFFLDAGTSTQALAGVMADMYAHQPRTIVTNSLAIGEIFADAGVPGVSLVGGSIRPFTRSIVGEQAVSTIGMLRADIAFLGTNGVSVEHGFSTPDPSEAAVKRAMIAHAAHRVVLCDSSKFGSDYMVTFAKVAEIDTVVTDADVFPSHVQLFSAYDVKVLHL